MNYYFEMDKKKKPKFKGEKLKLYGGSLKKVNQAIKERLSGINQDKLDQMLKASGVGVSPEEYIMLKWFLAAIIGGIFYFLSGKLLLLLPGGIIGYIVPKFWVTRKTRIRIQKFNEGLPDMITTVVGSSAN
jgi:tight adherence protein B